jgi:glutamate---cysteine ligase / carboxylate-amine ligase
MSDGRGGGGMREPGLGGRRRVGVEEELFLVDPATGRLRPVSERTLRADAVRRQHVSRRPEPQVEQELFLEQVETATIPCETMGDLDLELRRGRRLVDDDAAAVGAAIAALGTAVLVGDTAMTPKSRYQRMAAFHGLVARDNLVCGTHVHVEMADDDAAVSAFDRIRPWLPLLLAVSANSPYWHGEDTDYASFRAQVVGRWPSAGPTEPFGTAAGYRAAVDEMVRSRAALDEAMIYFDARLAVRYPTLEIRVPDVCTEVGDTVLVAALARALVETALREAAEGNPVPAWRTELLRAATWTASRWGLGKDLLHPVAREPRPAFEVIGALIDHVGPELDAAGDSAMVQNGLNEIRTRGTGSVRQRAVFSRRSRAEDVMLDAVERTRATYS